MTPHRALRGSLPLPLNARDAPADESCGAPPSSPVGITPLSREVNVANDEEGIHPPLYRWHCKLSSGAACVAPHESPVEARGVAARCATRLWATGPYVLTKKRQPGESDSLGSTLPINSARPKPERSPSPGRRWECSSCRRWVLDSPGRCGYQAHAFDHGQS